MTDDRPEPLHDLALALRLLRRALTVARRAHDPDHWWLRQVLQMIEHMQKAELGLRSMVEGAREAGAAEKFRRWREAEAEKVARLAAPTVEEGVGDD